MQSRISEKLIEDIRSFDTLHDYAQYQTVYQFSIESHKILTRVDLTKEEWFLIKELNASLPKKEAPMRLDAIFPLSLLIARAPSEEVDLLNTISSKKWQEITIQRRNIWLKILELESENNKTSITAKETWGKLSNLFFAPRKDGKKITGLQMRREYWFEGFNKGRVIPQDYNWYEIWQRNEIAQSFFSWCDAVGLPTESLGYCSDEQRKLLQIAIVNGKLFDMENKLIDSYTLYQGITNCVVALDESFYCDVSQYNNRHHSTFMEGKPVLFAGEIGVNQGEITMISLKSGHYQPTEKDLLNFLKVLEKQGILLENITLKSFNHDIISENAKDYLNFENARKDSAINKMF